MKIYVVKIRFSDGCECALAAYTDKQCAIDASKASAELRGNSDHVDSFPIEEIELYTEEK